MPNKFFDRNWWKDFVVAILATTVSIVLTFGTSKLIEHNNQKKERRLTALMVMSSIESFARSIDESAEVWDRLDSVAVWLLRMPIEEVERLGEEPFEDAVNEVFQAPIIRHDQTAETIFSSNIDTWKNMGNFQFVDNVGACFSQMNWIEGKINEEAVAYTENQARIFNHFSDYPGKTFTEKLLRDEVARKQLQMPNSFKAWLAYCSDNLRRMNRKNMKLIGIPEEEVLAFTDARAEVAVEEEPLPDYSDFMKPHPDKESIDSNLDYARQLDSLLSATPVPSR
jgi:hypothetical protein